LKRAVKIIIDIYITLQWYQALYIELKEKNLLGKISVSDSVKLISEIKKVSINGKWYLNEVSSRTGKLAKNLELKIDN